MAAKKVAAKAAKGAAKKVAAKAAHKLAKKAAKKTGKHPGHDVRRAFEHLYRLHGVRSLLDAPVLDEMRALSGFAQAALAAGDPKSAAELLRAAEHLAFGTLASDAAVHDMADDLRAALKEEFHHRMERAAERWDDQDRKPARAIKALYKRMRSDAKEAWKDDAFARALEFARGADALAHAHTGDLQLASPEDSQVLLAL